MTAGSTKPPRCLRRARRRSRSLSSVESTTVSNDLDLGWPWPRGLVPASPCVASPRPGTTVPGFTSCSRLTHLERKIRKAFQPLANLSFRLIWSRVRQCLECRRHSIVFRVCLHRAVGYRSRQRDEEPARQDFNGAGKNTNPPTIH